MKAYDGHEARNESEKPMTTTRTQAEKLAQKIAYVQSHSVPCYEHNGQLVIVSRFSVRDANGIVG